MWYCILINDMPILWKGVFDRISFQVLFCHNRGVSLLGISEAAAQLGLQTTCGRSGDGQCHCCECTQEQQPIFLEIDEQTKGTVLLCCKPRDFGNLIFI